MWTTKNLKNYRTETPSKKVEKICINKIVGNKQDTVVVEGDAIVPDVKPDILNTISSSGTVCIYKKEAMERKNKNRWRS